MNRREFITNSGLIAGATLFAGCGTPSANAKQRLLVGAARAKVTPPLFVPYLTSSGKGTNAPFEGFHDDLFARALILDDGQNAIAILAVDSIGYDNTVLGPGRDFTAELRRKVSKETGLKPEAVMLSATHSHSTPETIGLTPFRDAPGVSEWLERHLDELAATVMAAWRNRAPAQARHGTTNVTGIARYRRIRLRNGTESRRGPLPPPEDVAVPWRLDEELSVLNFEHADGSPLAVLLNYTAHPIVAMTIPKVSADYPGSACALVERELPGAVCLFTQGAAGNINTVQVATNFSDVQTIGSRLGRAAIASLRSLKPIATPTVAHQSRRVALAPRKCPSLAEVERIAAREPAAKNQVMLRLARKLAEDSLHAEVQAMRLGPARWVSLPGEPFVETGFALKEAGASFVVGYANGWHGYFPIRRAYDEGGYEANAGAWSRVAPGSAERLEAAARQLLKTTLP